MRWLMPNLKAFHRQVHVVYSRCFEIEALDLTPCVHVQAKKMAI